MMTMMTTTSSWVSPLLYVSGLYYRNETENPLVARHRRSSNRAWRHVERADILDCLWHVGSTLCSNMGLSESAGMHPKLPFDIIQWGTWWYPMGFRGCILCYKPIHIHGQPQKSLPPSLRRNLIWWIYSHSDTNWFATSETNLNQQESKFGQFRFRWY
jgi:hypothetical protein